MDFKTFSTTRYFL